MSRWDGIEEFVAVARHTSFKKAAEQLGSSTSHVSRAVSRLEAALSAPLFFRTTRQVTLTDTGRLLLEQCRQLVRDRDETFAMIEGNGDPQGDLRVTCAVALGERFIAPILQGFIDDHPQVNVQLDLSNQHRDLTAEGFDLAIRTGELENSRLVRTRLATRRWQLAASPAYLEKRSAPQTLSDLRKHDCLLGTADTWQFRKDKEPLEFRPAARFRCNSGVAILNAALSDMGICRLPVFYMREAFQAGTLVALLEPFEAEPEPIWAVYPHRRHVVPKVYMLVERLKSELSHRMR